MLADLVSEKYFAALSDWLLWLVAIGSIPILVYGADRAVGGAVRLAAALGMSKIIIGATVVSLGTTSPECFVSVTAAFEGKPGLALANGVGSIICDTALIFGLCCCIKRLPKDKFILKRHGWLQLGAGALLVAVVVVLAVARGGITGVVIPRPVGVAFVVLLGVYLYLSVRWAKAHPQVIRQEAQAAPKPAHRIRRAMGNLGMIIVGLAAVVFGANMLVGSVSRLCLRYHVPPNVMGVTLVAFGTSLPELVTAIVAIVRGHPELLVGNVIGADILNVLFVIGASASAVPLRVPEEFFFIHLPVMMVALVLLRLFIFHRGETFRRWHGVPLLLVFAGYYAALLALVMAGKLEYTPMH